MPWHLGGTRTGTGTRFLRLEAGLAKHPPWARTVPARRLQPAEWLRLRPAAGPVPSGKVQPRRGLLKGFDRPHPGQARAGAGELRPAGNVHAVFEGFAEGCKELPHGGSSHLADLWPAPTFPGGPKERASLSLPGAGGSSSPAACPLMPDCCPARASRPPRSSPTPPAEQLPRERLPALHRRSETHVAAVVSESTFANAQRGQAPGADPPLRCPLDHGFLLHPGGKQGSFPAP